MFTYDTATDIGKVRLEIGDDAYSAGVKPDGTNFSDEEIQVYIDREGSVMRAVAGLCEALANRWAVVADISVGPRRESLSQVSQGYRDRSQSLRLQYGGAGQGVVSVQPNRVDGFSEYAEGEEYES